MSNLSTVSNLGKHICAYAYVGFLDNNRQQSAQSDIRPDMTRIAHFAHSARNKVVLC
jgi:hypothetical protein